MSSSCWIFNQFTSDTQEDLRSQKTSHTLTLVQTEEAYLSHFTWWCHCSLQQHLNAGTSFGFACIMSMRCHIPQAPCFAKTALCTLPSKNQSSVYTNLRVHCWSWFSRLSTRESLTSCFLYSLRTCIEVNKAENVWWHGVLHQVY